jgi:hypothetical protein
MAGERHGRGMLCVNLPLMHQGEKLLSFNSFKLQKTVTLS